MTEQIVEFTIAFTELMKHFQTNRFDYTMFYDKICKPYDVILYSYNDCILNNKEKLSVVDTLEIFREIKFKKTDTLIDWEKAKDIISKDIEKYKYENRIVVLLYFNFWGLQKSWIKVPENI
jgi:hypothetical protein